MRNVAIGVAGGFAAGALSRSENKAEWGLLFGGAGGTGAAVATALFADDSVEEQNKKLIEEKEALEEKLRVFDHGTPAANSHSKKTKGIVGYSAEVPEAVKDMVSLGEWQHEAYENNWVKKDENRYEKVCEAVTVVPPGMIGQ